MLAYSVYESFKRLIPYKKIFKTMYFLDFPDEKMREYLGIMKGNSMI